ncbi:MAG: ATPase, T2SS/T4P/T4SS family, partial [Candidatus Gastranaerophilales bacterium]|nr:ATPase, T2SS/T4P/T4SS family [Candidatus Gastranaerophilales bacterium]
IEIRIEGINQVQVNIKADVTFASSMRAILRQDPDIIMVGEIRDKETLEIAIKAALTGHLVMSTIHTNSAVETLTRLIEMGAANYLVASSLVGVIAQRLVRKLCPHCKEGYRITDDEINKIITNSENASLFKERDIFKPKGCGKCDFTGYIGRIGLYEALPVNREIKKMISQASSIIDIEEVAISSGMKTLANSCLEHILKGHTTVDEFIRVLGFANE